MLLVTRTRKLTEDVWTVELIRCGIDYHTKAHTLALACLGLDYTRLWPLPVIQPWEG